MLCMKREIYHIFSYFNTNKYITGTGYGTGTLYFVLVLGKINGINACAINNIPC